MSGNISSGKTVYTEIDGTAVKNTFLVAGGGVGWVSTDISGSDVPAAAQAVVLRMTVTVTGFVGARIPGSANAPLQTGGVVQGTCQHDFRRLIELYRLATDNQYYIMGYWA